MATSYLEVPRRLRTSVQTVVRGRYLDRFRSLESLFSPSSDSSVGLRIRQNGAMGLVVALGRSLAGPPFAHLSPRVVGGFVPRDVLVRTPGSPRCVNGGPAILGAIPGTSRISQYLSRVPSLSFLFHFTPSSLFHFSPFISPSHFSLFHPLISLSFLLHVTLSFLFRLLLVYCKLFVMQARLPQARLLQALSIASRSPVARSSTPERSWLALRPARRLRGPRLATSHPPSRSLNTSNLISVSDHLRHPCRSRSPRSNSVVASSCLDFVE